MASYAPHIRFQSTVELDIKGSLLTRVNSLKQAPEQPPTTSDKWLLSSALQKLIRRGVAASAVAIAVKLHQVDPLYLRRRLPIIALEDIGMGDLTVCQEVLALCSSSQWWGDDSVKTVTFIASAMASAIKSRAACDTFCLTEISLDRQLLLPQLLQLDAVNLIHLACDRCEPQLKRLFALRILGGITVMESGAYQTLSRCNLAALDAVAVKLKLPTAIRWLMARQRKTAGMAAMLPVVFEIAHDASIQLGSMFPRSLDKVEGLPLCSLDQYTQLGKLALRRFYLASEELHDFARQHVPFQTPQPVINLAMFQRESSLLERHLGSPQLDALREATEEAEMLNMGMVDPANRTQLYRLLENGADRLAAIRTEILSPGSVRDAIQATLFDTVN